MSMVGANAEALEAGARQMRQAADELDAHAKSIQGTIGGLSWFGQVATNFLSMWNGGHRVRLGSTAAFIRDAAAKLERQAHEQRTASEAGGAPMLAVPITAGVASSSPTPSMATPEQIARAVASIERPANAARRVLPGAVSRLEAWAKELQTGEHSAAEVQAFLKYKEMIILANSLRATVGMAAESGIAARNAAVDGAVDVGLSVEMHAAGGVGESGVGGKLAEANLGAGGTETASAAVGEMAEGAVETGADAVAKFVAEKAGLGLETGDPVAIRQAYEARADAFLQQHEAAFRASTNGKEMDAAFIRTNAVNEYHGKYQVAVAQGDVASAFDLGPDWATSSLSTAMDVLVPHSGTATFAVLGTAEASANAIASAQYLNVAVDGSMDQLARSMVAMKL